MQTAQAAAAESPTNRDEHLSGMLVKMYEGNYLKGVAHWKKVSLPRGYSHKSNVIYSLELCQFVMTPQEIALFTRPNSFADRKDLLDLAGDIERRSFRKMYEFEGKDPDIEVQVNSREPSSRQKTTKVGGIGPRVMQYKKTFGGRHVDLRERQPAEAEEVVQGTPPGNTSILAFVGQRNN